MPSKCFIFLAYNFNIIQYKKINGTFFSAFYICARLREAKRLNASFDNAYYKIKFFLLNNSYAYKKKKGNAFDNSFAFFKFFSFNFTII